ncbi:hypothetical protein [Nocardia miyunensis]|uniref:hypothetical protein n=1 Tax=Nocardia miyunensis TaxID=282684 RepID=UPI000831F38C|nr:hypothetical protein [Nocardia miyunensis]
MPWTTGRYAESGKPATLRSRLFWLRHNVGTFLLEVRDGLSADTGFGHSFQREWGGWAVRPRRGWRRIRRVTPPTHYTRRYSADEHDAALDWILERMGLPH